MEEHDIKNPTEKFKGNLLECRKYIHSEYLQKVNYCNNKLLFRSSRFMNGTYALSAGVLLVVLIKYGGGTQAL